MSEDDVSDMAISNDFIPGEYEEQSDYEDDEDDEDYTSEDDEDDDRGYF